MRPAAKRLFGSLWSGLVTGVIVGVAIIMPAATDAQASIALEGSFRAANVTANDTKYKEAVDATYGQVIKLQVYYANTAKEDANDVRVKIAMPEKSGAKQTVTATVKGSNSNELKDQVILNLDKEQAVVQYIPGTAVWKHNSGSAEEPKIEETKISDEVVAGAQGVALEKQKPGAVFGSTVSIQAKVMVPGVKVVKETEVKGEANKWSANNSSKPADTMRHLISYQNTSNSQQKQVVVRSALPPKMQLVSGSTMLYNSSNPNGVKVDSDAISAEGIVIGNYGPGANAYIIFETTFAAVDQLACGNNEFRTVGYVRPEGAGEYFSSSVTTAKRECANPTPAQPQQAAAAYSCDLLTLTKGDNRKVTAKVEYTAKNGAKLKLVSYNFGDATPALSTDKTTVDHTYAKDGTYTVTATLTITSNGKDQPEPVTSAACAQQVSFAPAAPAAPSQSASTSLPDSGPDDVALMFVGASVVGFLVHHLVISRWLQRS